MNEVQSGVNMHFLADTSSFRVDLKFPRENVCRNRKIVLRDVRLIVVFEYHVHRARDR